MSAKNSVPALAREARIFERSARIIAALQTNEDSANKRRYIESAGHVQLVEDEAQARQHGHL